MIDIKSPKIKWAIIGLLSFVIGVALYFGILSVYSKITKSVAEEYIKIKIVDNYHNVAKLMDLNSKNLVDDLLKKIDTLPLNLAEENQKLREKIKEMEDIRDQKKKNISGMLTR